MEEGPRLHSIVVEKVINLGMVHQDQCTVAITGENIPSTHAESVYTNYESHSVCKIYIFLYVVEVARKPMSGYSWN